MKNRYVVCSSIVVAVALLFATVMVFAAVGDGVERTSIWESDPLFATVLLAVFIAGIAVIIAVNIFLYNYRKNSAQLRMNDTLASTRQSFQNVLDMLPVAVALVDTESSTLVYANSVCCRLFEYDSVENIYGKHVSMFFPESERQRPTVSDKISKIVSLNTQIRFDANYLTGNGNIFEGRVIASPIEYNGKEANLEIIQDLADIKKLERAKQSLQTILNSLSVPVRIVDSETAEILYVNNACVKLFGYKSHEEMCDRPVSDMMPVLQSDGTESSDKIKHLLSVDETFDLDIEYIAADGRIIDGHLIACTIDYMGRKSTLGIITDLAAKKEYEKMLMNAAQKEKEANQLKSRFLVNMSHEIRTPMNAIIGLTEIELRKKQERQTEDTYKKINTSAKNLLEIINDILDLSKVEADKIELYSDEFELEEVLSSAMLVAEPRLDGKNVEFILNASLDLPRFVVGDRTRLWQILKNFLDNSAKYTEEGKIMLTIFNDSKGSDEETARIIFAVEDTGIGMGDEDMRRIFMPYEQIYNNAQKRYTGTGLGMVISKHLCEIMGGKMQIESKTGEGTSIYMNIPFQRSKNNETERDAIKTSELSGMKVLAVDDDEISLSIMSEIITGSSAFCECARSGEEAMSIILESRDRGEAYDLILLDYMMDGLNGLETARQIQTGLSKAPKLLIVTAYQRLLIKRELDKYNIADVVEKPFIPSKFVNKICEVLGLSGIGEDRAEETMVRFKDARVLLCEDYRLNQEIASGMLEQFGISAEVAENGKEAIELLNSGKTFDLILMDLQMPVMDGYEATKIIRANKKFGNIPIISLTADAMKEVTDKCMEIGMNGHIAKPIEFNSLQKALLDWLPKDKHVQTDVVVKQEPDLADSVLSRFGGKKDRYEKALVEFSGTLRDEWPAFDNIATDIEATKRYIHKIKGAAGNLSETELYQNCASFEDSLRNNAPDKDLYNKLSNTCHAFQKRVAELLKSSTGINIEAGTAAEFAEIMNKLREALEDYDLKRIEVQTGNLRARIWPAEYNEKMEQLHGYVEDYDYDAALRLIETIEIKI